MSPRATGNGRRAAVCLLVLFAAIGLVQLFRSSGFREYRLRRMSEEELRLWTAQRPGDALGHYYRGRALDRSGRAGEAAREYATALDLDPTLTVACPPLAALLAASGRDRAAEVLLRQGVALESAQPALHAGLGRIYERREDYRRAASAWERVTSLAPSDADAWFHLGRCWATLGDDARALRPYQRAVERAPLSATYQKALAGILRLRGRYAEAERHGRRALFLRPDDPEAHFERAKLLRDRDGATREAEESMRRAVALQADDPMLRYYLGAIRQERGELEPAAAAYEAALHLLRAPGRSDARDAWGGRALWLSYLKGAHFNLAGIEQRRGHPAAAARHLAEFRRISEHQLRVDQSRRRIAAREERPSLAPGPQDTR